MYKYKLAKEVPHKGSGCLLCTDGKSDDLFEVSEIEFSVLRKNRSIDLSGVSKLKYRRDFELHGDSYKKLRDTLSKHAPTFVYEYEVGEVTVGIVCIGCLKDVVVSTSDNIGATPMERAESLLKLGIKRYDELLSRSKNRLSEVKSFADIIFTTESVEKFAKCISNDTTETLIDANLYAESQGIFIATSKSGIFTINNLRTACNDCFLKKLGELKLQTDKANSVILDSSLGKLINPIPCSDDSFENRLSEFCKSLLSDDTENDKNKSVYRIKEVHRLKSGSFDTIVSDGENSISLTEIELGGYFVNGLIDTSDAVDLINNQGVSIGLYIKFDSSVVTRGMISEENMCNCVIYVNGLVPVLLSFIETDGMTDEERTSKVLSYVENGVLRKLNEYCSLNYKAFLSMRNDFYAWLSSHQDKCKAYDKKARVSDKRYEGVSPLVTETGAVRFSVLVSWFNRRSTEYRKGILANK